MKNWQTKREERESEKTGTLKLNKQRGKEKNTKIRNGQRKKDKRKRRNFKGRHIAKNKVKMATKYRDRNRKR